MNVSPQSTDEEAVFNIGTAARKSGLSVTTIRTWEDRYGAVVPIRDKSGRRLYSPEQITQLTWLREQIDAGLRASEAHRLLKSGEMHSMSSGTVIDRGSAWATFMSWVETESGWVSSIEKDLLRGLEASATALASIIPNPMSGAVVTIINTETATADASLGFMSALVADQVPEIANALESNRGALIEGSKVGSEAAHVAIVPLKYGGAVAGALLAFGDLDDKSVELVERAAQVIESRIEADRARSAFANLLD